MKEWLASIFELCLYLAMQNLSSFDGAVAPASREAHPATEVASHSLPSRPSSSPAGAKPERFDASGPARPSPAAGTAGAAAPLGSGPPFDRHAAGPCARSCIRTQDGTVILFEPMTGRAVSAPDRKTAEARLARLTAGHSIRSG
ncbi:hypothetical protein [Mesorhizobium loti]|uniref:Uncharacterized protein n=2 Tax=Mesorhizobium TaxID=68287 RepID=A0A6M7TZA8_RHILI|nr:hypothetical protein [Mesorhizobium loti]KRB23383.1 hypothetical protein ASE05_12220 [Mesorhizobium sp. Root172]OBQ66725.1 hypothetical protein A8145_30390 [Mesorhizobium loti]QKC70489.1 hypothetical protein EB815_16145 [Mesorhizobium loti]